MCLKQERTISCLSGEPLKLKNKFLYLSINILSTESDVNIYIYQPRRSGRIWHKVNF